MKFIILILALIGLASCSNGSSNSKKGIIEVNFYQDLPQCNADLQLTRAIVKSENKGYICSSNQWIEDNI